MALILLVATRLQTPLPPEVPPVPYYDHGACPFECCVYRDWTASERVRAVEHYDPPGRTAPAFNIAAEETVTAMTGVVITNVAGRVRIKEPTTLTVYSKSFPRAKSEQLRLDPGDLLYLLTYIGEGHYRGWYRGRLLESFDSWDYRKTATQEAKTETAWWAKIRNRRGQIGWVRVERNFSNTDACAPPVADQG